MSFEPDNRPSTPLEEQVLALLRQAASAHSFAFAHVNSVDPEWPQWYADFLVQPFSSLFGHPVDARLLAADLAALDVEQRQQAPDVDWSIYYTSRLVSRYNP